MKTKNKLILTLGSIASIVSPIALTVSCGGKDQKNTNKIAEVANPNAIALRRDINGKNDDKVILGTTWSQGKPQYDTLEALANVYNEKMKNEEGFLKVEIRNIGSGYSAGYTHVVNSLQSGNDDIENIILNYPTVSARVAEKGMSLNFDDEDPKYATKLENIASSFSKSNTTTENLYNKGTWIIPFAKSSVAMGIDAPVLYYVIHSLNDKGFLDVTGLTWFNDLETAAGTNDEATVKSIWGDLVSDAELNNIWGTTGKFIVDDNTFQSGKELINFCSKAQMSFQKSKDKDNGTHLIGIDDLAGFIEIMSYSNLGADDLEMFITTQEDEKNKTKTVNFSKVSKENSKAGKTLTEIYQMIKLGIESNALKPFGDGEYSSSATYNHKAAFSIGSTAGFNYMTKEDLKYYAPLGIFNLNGNDYSFTNNGSEVSYYFKKDDKGKDKFVVGSHANGIYASSSDKSKISKYEYILEDATKDAELENLRQAATNEYISSSKGEKGNYDNVVYLIPVQEDSEKSFDTVKKINALKDYSKNNPTIMADLGIVEKDPNGGANKYHLFVQKTNTPDISVNILSDEKVLNKKEFIAKPNLSKWVKSNQYNVSYVQGPSLIGIHTNEKRDKATKLFVKWLVNNKTKYDFIVGEKKPKTFKDKTPSQLISSSASYIFPAKGFDNDENSKNIQQLKNGYIEIAYEGWKKTISEPDKWVTYEEPASLSSQTFRDAFIAAFKSIYSRHQNGNTIGSYRDVIINSLNTSNAKDLIK